jgi:hypothetical protein
MPRPATGQVVERDGKHGTSYALRFRAFGRRWYITTDARTRADAEDELAYTLHQVKRGLWRPPVVEQPEPPQEEPTLHVLSSEWLARRQHEVDARTVDYWR